MFHTPSYPPGPINNAYLRLLLNVCYFRSGLLKLCRFLRGHGIRLGGDGGRTAGIC